MKSVTKKQILGLLEELEEEGVDYIENFCSSPETSVNKAEMLENLFQKNRTCMKCRLGETRKNYVFGEGNPGAQILFIGEAPGRDEDLIGKPFVGRAGKLLNDIIEKGMKIKREDVYICNILKCRPPENRDPLPDEVDMCIETLITQINIIDPKIICALGRHAASALLKKGQKLSDYRGKVHYFRSYPVIVTYHPSALLRNPNLKKPTWEDIKILLSIAQGCPPEETGAW
ncbi:uracil-DNA glycosylase [candidate division WOR-3 bacterium]|nr:uracil-DNA glycosylase [candidate division WOR-3 bacterium]